MPIAGRRWRREGGRSDQHAGNGAGASGSSRARGRGVHGGRAAAGGDVRVWLADGGRGRQVHPWRQRVGQTPPACRGRGPPYRHDHTVMITSLIMIMVPIGLLIMIALAIIDDQRGRR